MAEKVSTSYFLKHPRDLVEISRVGVIGAGAMGSGIAQICAEVGWKVTMYDAFQESLKKGDESISDFWKK